MSIRTRGLRAGFLMTQTPPMILPEEVRATGGSTRWSSCIQCLKCKGPSEQRFGPLKIQENSFVHVGTELAQKADFSVGLTQAEFTRQLKFMANPAQF